MTTGPNVTKLFMAVIYNVQNKLRCLFLAGLSSLVKCSQEGLEPNRVKHISDAQLWGRHLAFPRKHKTSLEIPALPGTNMISYRKH
jgi:hypothetical protein